MTTPLGSIFGKKVYISSLAVSLVKGKLFPYKKWHSKGGCYSRRQQKKLDKKHGPPTYEPSAFATHDSFFIHPALYLKVEAELKRNHRSKS